MTTDIIIPSGTPYAAIVDLDPASPAVCNNITINNGATLSIAPGKALTAYGSTSNNGNFIIQSDASGTGSFIDDGTETGNVTVHKYMTSGRYWYLGAPTSNATAICFT